MGKCASNPIKHVLFNSTFQKKKKKKTLVGFGGFLTDISLFLYLEMQMHL